MELGDVIATTSDISPPNYWVGFMPNTSIKVGVTKFVECYCANYQQDGA